MIIKELNECDIPAVAELERLSFRKPWSEDSIRDSFNSASCRFYIAETDIAVGYIGVSVAADEGYILNVAVHPGYRGQGIGKALVRFLIERYKDILCFLTLEVRPSNTTAVNLYKSLGFIKVGERKNYYSDPAENALLLTNFFDKENDI